MSETIRMCNVEIKVDGDEFIAVITHHLPPLGDNRSEVPPKELRCHSKEDLLTEVVKYLGDCYEE
jgi:hypothetical protein